MAAKPYVIAIEEHYTDPDIAATFRGYGKVESPPIEQRLADLSDLRVKEMDDAGIDLQVLSHKAPSVQTLDGETATRLARQANNRLAEAVLRATRPLRRVRGNPDAGSGRCGRRT